MAAVSPEIQNPRVQDPRGEEFSRWEQLMNRGTFTADPPGRHTVRIPRFPEIRAEASRQIEERRRITAAYVAASEATRRMEESFAARIADMTVAERIVLYNVVFDQTKNQTTLTTSARPMVNKSEDNGAREHSDRSQDSLILSDRSAILRAISGLLGYIPDTDNDSGRISRSQPRVKSTIIHPRRTGDAENGVQETNGSCAICLDDLKAGEKVVWSESESCPHVYHKDCLVEYFATMERTRHGIPIGLDANPCPVCRQTFVTLDIAKCTPLNIDSFQDSIIGSFRIYN